MLVLLQLLQHCSYCSYNSHSGHSSHYVTMATTPLQVMLHAFKGAGYDVTWHLVNVRGWVPQSRKRLYFVGFRSDLHVPPFTPPDAGHLAPRRVRDILEPAGSEAVALAAITAGQWAKIQTPEFCAKAGRAAAEREIHLDGVAPTLTSSCHTATSLSARFVFEEEDGTRRTLPRFLTPRECARVMGFPESFRFTPPERDGRHHHIYRQMGNAVVPPVIQAFAQAMLTALEAADIQPTSTR